MIRSIRDLRWFAFVLVLAIGNRLRAEKPEANGGAAVVWQFARLDDIAGHNTTLAGSPRLIEAHQGKAVEFDGKTDGIFLDVNPVSGLKQFTAEVIFRPYAAGPKEQRFLHFQEDGSDN